MNIKAVSTNVGKALLVSALFMFLSTIVSIIDGRDSAFGPLAISCLITLIVGAFPFIFVKKAPPLTLHDGFLTIVLSWFLSFIFGMLPYVLWGGEFTLVNAWFESVSGYTTTGATILTNVEALPRSLLFWRSSIQIQQGGLCHRHGVSVPQCTDIPFFVDCGHAFLRCGQPCFQHRFNRWLQHEKQFHRTVRLRADQCDINHLHVVISNSFRSALFGVCNPFAQTSEKHSDWLLFRNNRHRIPSCGRLPEDRGFPAELGQDAI